MNQNLPLAVLLTVLTTVLFAWSATLQHGVVGEQVVGEQVVGERSEDATGRQSLSGGQLWALVRSPRWWLGMALNGAGAVISVAALMLAPVTVVQPLAILAVPWTVLLASRMQGHRVAPALWGAVGLAVAGTGLFAVVAVRHAVEHDVFDDSWLVVGALVVFAVAGALAVVGARGPVAWRCFAWASAGAVIFGLESGLVKAAGEYVGAGSWRTSATFWIVIVMLVAGSVVATALMQQGYANGPAETVVGAMNAVGPIAAVVFGIAVLGEGAAITATAAATMVLAAALAVTGVILLSRFHPASRESEPEQAEA
ncbi:hypothetical protein [Raineyella sp.]|uniref:hypothetical protein n=1 Tax=Raineyella sp. TaxID=1911550 RepID=UPI002B205100|nr:hypothetical protein [Raineyella sp.]MEA5155439.1 hypothetical protein [Raineyella sp.]